MKILYFRLIIIQSLLLITIGYSNFYAQSTAATNAYLAGRFIGWTNTNGTNPLLFKTNNENRMKLNATVSYTVNGYAGIRNGYLLIGQTIGSNYSSNTEGAASLLHLNGFYNSTSQPALGYRPWMETGITLSDNDDLSYFGLRRVNNNLDLTETTISWSNDNDNPGNVGPDDMVFRFTSGSAGTIGNTINDDLLTSEDLDGLHISRYTFDGNMGLGNTFGVNGLNNITGR